MSIQAVGTLSSLCRHDDDGDKINLVCDEQRLSTCIYLVHVAINSGCDSKNHLHLGLLSEPKTAREKYLFVYKITFCLVESFLLKKPTCDGRTGERMDRNDF